MVLPMGSPPGQYFLREGLIDDHYVLGLSGVALIEGSGRA